MYGKIFSGMYDGTLYGNWQAIVTMQQLIVLADKHGVVDMTPQAIAARTSIPIEIIQQGLDDLAAPDPHSRTPGEDGRRITLIDDHRPWGWVLVNFEKYRALTSAEDKREQAAERKRRQREREKRSAEESDVTPCHAPSRMSRHTEAEAEAEIEVPDGTSCPEARFAEHQCVKGEVFVVTTTKIAEWSEAYPGVDVPAEVRRALQWLRDRPKRNKTRAGMTAYLGSWLARTQDRGARAPPAKPRSAVERVDAANGLPGAATLEGYFSREPH